MAELLERTTEEVVGDEQDLEEVGMEDDDSGEAVDISYIPKVVVYGTDWTTETMVNQLVRGNIDITPDFQRRDAWNLKKKSRLIESLILGLPVPPIVLAERDDAKGKFIVLDGKQRLLTVFQFYGKSGFTNDNFRLTGLEILKQFNGYSYSELKVDANLMDVLNALDNQTIRTTIIRSWQQKSFLYAVFARLNTQNTPLSPQELRKSLYPGEFSNFIDEQSANSQGLRLFFGLNRPDSRMRDTQILLKYIAFQLFLPDYKGVLNQFLNSSNERLNELWLLPREQSVVRNITDNFETAIQLTIKIFGEENFARIWRTDQHKYEQVRNQSALEIMLFYFSDKKIQARLTEINLYKTQIEQAFQNLCGSSEFTSTMRSSTQNLGNTSTRLKLWGEALKEVLEIDFEIPQLVEKTFIYKS
ncbi:MAG: DUF262 domain-containing protein [Snowella sp.]|nr:DUF262 domain-containing protein [Snowella sp.]